MTGYVAYVADRQPRLEQRRDQRGVQDRRLEQRLAERALACNLCCIAVGQPPRDQARERRAVGVQPAGGNEHDLVARAEVLAEDRGPSPRHGAHGGARQLDLALVEQPGQRRRLSAAPHAAGVGAGASPPLQQGGGALALQVPLRDAGCEVGVHDEWQRAAAAEIVEDRRDRIVGDVPEPVDALALEHLAGDDRLRAQALDDERECLLSELEHERGLAPRCVEGAAAARQQQRRGRQGLCHRQPLAGIERAIVHARRAVAAASGAHQR